MRSRERRKKKRKERRKEKERESENMARHVDKAKHFEAKRLE